MYLTPMFLRRSNISQSLQNNSTPTLNKPRMSASQSQKELMASNGSNNDVLRTVQWLQERVRRSNIAEDAKKSLVHLLEWITTKFRNAVGGGVADFVNDHLRRICGLIDVIAPSVPTTPTHPAKESNSLQDFEDVAAGEEEDGELWDPGPADEQCDFQQPEDSAVDDPQQEHLFPSHRDSNSHLNPNHEPVSGSHRVASPSHQQERRMVRARNGEKHSQARDWMQQDFTPPPMTFTPPPDETAAPGPYDMQPHTAGRYYRPPPQYDYRALVPLQPDDHPDVHLNIPNLSVALIDFEIDEIQARVALEADVRNAVHIFVGVDAHIGRVKLTIEDVQATVQLTARLDNVRKILERGLDSVDGLAQPTLMKLLGGK